MKLILEIELLENEVEQWLTAHYLKNLVRDVCKEDQNVMTKSVAGSWAVLRSWKLES